MSSGDLKLVLACWWVAQWHPGLKLAHWLAEHGPGVSGYRALEVLVLVLACRGPGAGTSLLVSVLGPDTAGCRASMFIRLVSAHCWLRLIPGLVLAHWWVGPCPGPSGIWGWVLV